MAERRGGYESSSRRVTDLRNPPGVTLRSDEVCAIQDSSGAPGRLSRAHFEAVERVIAARLAPIVAACDLAEAEARHVVDDEPYVSVGLIRNALNEVDRPGKPSRGESPCCPGAGSMAHVRGCRNHPEADRG